MMAYISSSRRYRQLTLIISVFFFWGLMAASNGILIAFSKKYFHLSQVQAQLIDTSFYGAYFYGSLIVYLISYFWKKELIYVWGYKRSLIVGVSIATVATLSLSLIV